MRDIRYLKLLIRGSWVRVPPRSPNKIKDLSEISPSEKSVWITSGYRNPEQPGFRGESRPHDGFRAAGRLSQIRKPRAAWLREVRSLTLARHRRPSKRSMRLRTNRVACWGDAGASLLPRFSASWRPV